MKLEAVTGRVNEEAGDESTLIQARSKNQKLKWDIDQARLGHEIQLQLISHWFVKIIRSNQTWRVVESFSGESHCLERLALRKAYRVADVCRVLGCSSRYLYIVFVRDIGLSPKHWMNLERMVVARRKLEGGKPPEVVAKDLGFMSIHTFSRQFKRFYHTTPDSFLRHRRTFDHFVRENLARE